MSFAARFQSYLDDLTVAVGNHKRRHTGFKDYCAALTLPIERKSLEPLAASVDPENVQAKHQSLHNFVSNARWSDRVVLDRVTDQFVTSLPHDEALYWIVDDTGIPKKGPHSVGVSHQYCGQLGKQANCQVAVSLSLACESASLPIDYRLYLPKGWVDDEVLRKKTKVPEHIEFQTKPEIALTQIRDALKRGIEPGVVIADAGYGYDSAFRDALEELGLDYVVGIQSSTRVVRADEPTQKARSVETLLNELDRRSFSHITWRRGTNAPLHGWFARVRVRATTGETKHGGVRAEQWLLIEKSPGETSASYFLATLPASVSMQDLVSTTKMRWRIERDYQELKQEVGLNHFEGRSWIGFHHHATLCIAVYAFLTLERLRHPGEEKKIRRPKPLALPEGYIPRGSPAHAETC